MAEISGTFLGFLGGPVVLECKAKGMKIITSGKLT
jgi:hypothetical protein